MQFEHVYTKQVKIKCFSTVSETSPSDTGIMFPTGSNSASDSSNSLLLLKPPPGTELPRSASVGSAVPRPRPQVGIWWKKKVFVGLVGEIWLRVAFFNFFVAIFFLFLFFLATVFWFIVVSSWSDKQATFINIIIVYNIIFSWAV